MAVVVKPRGFAALKAKNPDALRAMASKAGKVAHAQGTAHTWTSEEARAAGKKGGKTHNIEHMRRISRLSHNKKKGVKDENDDDAGNERRQD